MHTSFAFSVAFLAATLLTRTATADPVFDSPGRGYREQLRRLVPAREPRPVRFSLHNPTGGKEVPVAYYTRSDQGASDRIRDVLSNAAISCSLKEGIAPTVFVKPTDRVKAKELLEQLPAEGHWSVIVIYEPKSESKSDVR